MFKNTVSKLNKIFLKSFNKQEIEDIKDGLFDFLIKADIPYDYTRSLVDKIGVQLNNINTKNVDKTEIVYRLLKKNILNTFKYKIKTLTLQKNNITVIGVFGTNGVGKTSFVAKLAYFLYKKHHRSVMCVSFDNKRSGANEQLRDLCEQNGVGFFALGDDVDQNLRIVNDIVKHNLVDVLIVDTAGFNPNAMKDVKDVLFLINKICFNEKLLVVDSVFNQGIVATIKLFNSIIKPTGLVVSKTDTNDKGCVFFSIRIATNVPIYFVTKGEKIDDICVFSERLVRNVINKICHFSNFSNKFVHRKTYKNDFCISKNNIDYNFLYKNFGYLIQKNRFNKIKSVFTASSFFSFGVKMTTESYMLIKKWMAIIQSMTQEERSLVCCLNIDRINRIAKGAGVEPSDVVMLKQKLTEIQKIC